MSETPETITPDTVTDAQIDKFFESGGSFEDSQPETASKPVNEATNGEPEKNDSQPEVAKEEPKEEKKVNLGALHEERARRKAEREAREAAERERDELRQQLQKFAQKQEPSFDDDPVEALRRENAQIKQVIIAQANKALTDNENAKYWERVRESENAFKQDKPDFDDAIKFLASTRMEELKDLGWDDQAASKVLADEIRWISDKAYADEVNPAERFYNLAMRRGFKPPEQKKELVSEVNEKLDRIEKGIKTNRQLPPASKSLNQDLTAEALADMNVDALSNLTGNTEFDKAWNKLFGS